MRVSKALAACGFVAIVAASITGCSDDSDDSSATTTTKATTTAAAATTTAAAAEDPAATQEITDAYVAFFNGTTPVDVRVGLLQDGATFQPALEGMASDPQASATTATVSNVEATGDDANVTYTLLMGGNPVLPDQVGQAVKEDGTWKVASATFCALLAVSGGGAGLPAGC